LSLCFTPWFFWPLFAEVFRLPGSKALSFITVTAVDERAFRVPLPFFHTIEFGVTKNNAVISDTAITILCAITHRARIISA
jgi:hypothetical protein